MGEQKLTIWIFQTGEPLHCDGDLVRPMRAMNLANALIERGHRVVLWSSSFYHQEKRHRGLKFERLQINESLEIRLIPSPGYKRNISISRLFDHFILSKNLKKELNAKSSAPDAAFVGYPPIETAAVMTHWLSARGVPTLLDVKDQWPSLLVQSMPPILRPVARLLLSPYYFSAKRTMRQATGLCAMSDSFLNWALDFSGRTRSDFDRVVPLTSPESSLATAEVVRASEWWSDQGIEADETCRIMFVGSFSRAFDFDAVFVAARELNEKGVNCEFVLCGDGELADSLRMKAEGCPNVTMIEWIDRPKIIALAERSSAALAPYRNSSDFIASIPNKVIDALLLGLPLLSPLQGEVANLINYDHAGLSYGDESGSSATLAECIIEIIESPRLQQSLADNARRLYEERFSFENVYGGLTRHLEKLVAVSRNYDKDKLVEKTRYDTIAENQLLDDTNYSETSSGSVLVTPMLRRPYLVYENLVEKHLSKEKKVLEIGAGTGTFTSTLLSTGASVHATDISEHSLEVLHKRLNGSGVLETNVADMEFLPFEDETFDVVTSAGSLSYGDNEIVMMEIFRVLKQGGIFICVDSLNHNPIYRLNRWMHYLRGNRTLSTLKRMPSISLIETYRKKFGTVEVQYFGAISWLIPLLRKIFGETKCARISDRFDEIFAIKKSAFKFVMVVEKVK